MARKLADAFVQFWAPGFWPLFAVLALVALQGCAGSFEEAAHPQTLGAAEPSEHCRSLDSTHRSWGGIAKGAGFAAGASGLSMIPLQGDEYKTARIGVAAAGVAAGITTGVAVFVSEDAANSWARDCTAPK